MGLLLESVESTSCPSQDLHDRPPFQPMVRGPQRYIINWLRSATSIARATTNWFVTAAGRMHPTAS
jgi:hypothetical protein